MAPVHLARSVASSKPPDCIEIKEHRQQDLLLFKDDRALLTAMSLGGPVALAVKRLTPQVMHEVENEFLDSVQQHRVSGRR
jgi:hypothetical protein